MIGSARIARTIRGPASIASALSVLLATLSFARDGRAFCREVTIPPPPGYDPVSQGCFGSAPGAAALEVFWRSQCVGYSLQRAASPLRGITLDEATALATQAFAAWSAVSCGAGGMPSIDAVNEGPVDCARAEYNKAAPNQHVILFHDDAWPYADSSNTLGFTTLTVDLDTGEIFDADMEINSHDFDLVLQAPVPSGAYDLQSVLTHEAGHFLGLAHSADSTAVMYAKYHPGQSVLAADDVAGICSVYPADGSRATSAGSVAGAACDPAPRHGFSTECGSDIGDAGSEGTGSEDAGSAASAAAAPSSVASGATPSSTSRRGCTVGPGPSPASHAPTATCLAWLALALAWVRRRRAKDAVTRLSRPRSASREGR
jgi:MYXO-CTERM domain-containing protein